MVGAQAHATIFSALRMLGLGAGTPRRVDTDEQGRMRPDALRDALATSDGPTIVCAQAGEVNTGACDPFEDIAAQCRAHGAWLHVDGAFGLWGAASPARRAALRGVERADSWATDAHKWLNVPYDSGIVFVREPRHLHAAMSLNAPYLVVGQTREPWHYTPDFSRRARGIEVWAALKALGRQGLADLVERTCRHAARFAEGLGAAGYRILNDVTVNQVLVAFGDAEQTRRVIAAIQADGTCWAGPSIWRGHTAMRISVSSWATADRDVERSLEAMIRVAARTLDASR